LVNEICEALDPKQQIFMGRLGRESTLLKNGQYIKDLSYLNRDIKDIIYLDFDDSKVQFHPDNALILPKWEGDRNDRELYDIMPFLESKRTILTVADLGQQYGQDARKEIQKYGREGTGKKFMEVQNARRDMIMKQRS